MENENKPEENSGTGEELRIEPVEKILAEMEKIAEQKGVGVEVSTLGLYARQIRVAIEDERKRWRGALGRSANAPRPNASSPALATVREMLDMLDHVKELLQGPGSLPASVCRLRDDLAAAASKIASAEVSRIVDEALRLLDQARYWIPCILDRVGVGRYPPGVELATNYREGDATFAGWNVSTWLCDADRVVGAGPGQYPRTGLDEGAQREEART